MQLFEKTTDQIYIFDIDDTLLFSKSQIGYKKPGDKDFVFVDTNEFAKIREKLPQDTEYNFDDFELYHNIMVSTTEGKPNIRVLKILDHAINSGAKIGILTARGNQDAVFNALKSFLLYRDKKGILKDLPKGQFDKKYVFAISDSKVEKFLKKFSKEDGGAENPSEKKAAVLKHIFKEMYGFKKIYFYDDDQGNIKAAKELNDDSIMAIKV